MPDGCEVLIADVKTIADIGRMQAQIENLKYYVQDAFYTAGVQQVLKRKVCFAFIFVSTSLSLGRYPVHVVVLDQAAKFDGNKEVSESMRDYARLLFMPESAWETAITIDRPAWATRDGDLL